MNYKITFFNDNVYNETMDLPPSILANLLRILELAEIYGGNLGKPYSAPLKNGLFEFRAKGAEGIARSIFANVKNREIVILHTFIKKSQKIPKKELDLALKRAKEIK